MGADMEDKSKTMFLVLKRDLHEVRSFLDGNNVSYLYEDKCTFTGKPVKPNIFPNIDVPPVGLEEYAELIDPVFEESNGWYHQLPGDEKIGPFLTEHKARNSFVCFISWCGEYINNEA